MIICVYMYYSIYCYKILTRRDSKPAMRPTFPTDIQRTEVHLAK